MFYILLTNDEFADIFRKYNKYLYTISKNTASKKFSGIVLPKEEIEDIVQTVFVKFFLQAQKEERIDNTKSLLARIAELTTINHVERYIRVNNLIIHDYFQDENDDIYDEANNPIDIILDDENFDELLSSIKSLDKKYSSVLLLKNVHKMSLKEISDISGISYDTICSWHVRGKRLLAQKLNQKKDGDEICI